MRITLMLIFIGIAIAASAQTDSTATDCQPDTTYMQRPDGLLDTLLVTAPHIEKKQSVPMFSIDKSERALIAASQKVPQGFNILGILYHLFRKANLKTPTQRHRERNRRALNEIYPDN